MPHDPNVPIPPLPPGALSVITTHQNADFDAVASMIAAGKLYPEAVMVFPGSQERNLRNFFIQSMIYLFNVARVKDIDLKKIRRLILVDTRQAERIGPLAEALTNEGLSIHIYDHHPDGPSDLHGELEMIGQAGANATLMTELLDAKGIALSPEEATVLAMGIYEDTGGFTFRSTTPRDLLAAARLLEKGADLVVVAEMISRELTAEQVSLLHEMIQSAEVHHVNGVDVVVTQAQTEQYVEELAVLVHKMMDMQNIHVLFALVLMENRVYLVARSRIARVNVAEVAQEMGGGGHPSAAAATIKDVTLTQAANQLHRVLAQVLGPVRTARDIMVFPVIHVSPDGSLQEARELMVRYDINVLLVIDTAGVLRGYISRQNVAKALHHGLPDYPVSEFMTTEFGVVNPEATFAQIQDLVVAQKQRVVPVVDQGRTVGVITRTDLLNILTSETNVPGSLIEEGSGGGRSRTKKILTLMRERLPKKFLDLLAELGRAAQDLGYGAYAVGGFVRDLLLRQENLDVDVVIEGDGIRFAESFASTRPDIRVRVHHKFNTAVLIWADGFKVDVTTARLEYYEHPAALPVVAGGSIHMDLYRRDFTINTLAVSLAPRNFGVVIDYFRGLRDLKEGFIRVLHNLSFVEDPTRVFRAIRFEQRFGFKIGKLTTTLIQNAVKHSFFLKLSGKRLSGEIRLILSEEDPAPAVARMAEFDLLKFIHPDLTFEKRARHVFKRIKTVRGWFSISHPKVAYRPWLVYFLGLVNGLGTEEMMGVCRRLSLHKDDIRVLVEEKPLADRGLGGMIRKKITQPSEVYQMLKDFSAETILFMMARTENEEIIRVLADHFSKDRHIRPDLSGEDLKVLGFVPGPLFKRILEDLLARRLNGELSGREEEIDYVRWNYDPSVVPEFPRKGKK
jgi:tRNA nucleotidyltransferase (CCA-adding enzyme)